MTHSPSARQLDPSEAEVILGIDTHKDAHVAAVLDAVGVLLGSASFPATADGYRRLLRWAQSFGVVSQAGVECTGSFGAGVARYLHSNDIRVIEVNHPDKATRRRRGKNDAIDAEMAARAVLSGRAKAIAKSNNGPVDMIRMYRNAKNSAIKARTQAINQIKSVLIRAESQLRESMADLSNTKLIRACAKLDVGTCVEPATAAAFTLRLLAHRVLRLTEEITELQIQLTAVIKHHRPQLLEQYGVGPDTAAALLITAGDNPDRLRSESSFAALCGVSPVEDSSGRIQRRRLNRGGNRQANTALHAIALCRLRWDPRTRSYMDRRVAEGKTRREALRCLKRYVAREIFQLITSKPANAAT